MMDQNNLCKKDHAGYIQSIHIENSTINKTIDTRYIYKQTYTNINKDDTHHTLWLAIIRNAIAFLGCFIPEYTAIRRLKLDILNSLLVPFSRRLCCVIGAVLSSFLSKARVTSQFFIEVAGINLQHLQLIIYN